MIENQNGETSYEKVLWELSANKVIETEQYTDFRGDSMNTEWLVGSLGADDCG